MKIISILFLSFALLLSVEAQIVVTGTVTDNTGEPLPGVNITVQGTTTGDVTDVNGKYSLTVPNRTSVLVFSYIGYTVVERVVGESRIINITLVEDTQALEEVVVIGYGTVRKSDLTGAVTSISSEKFKNLPQTGTTQILQGKAAGVNIISTGGQGNFNIRIRGTTSLNKSSEPLWVVDGVIGGVTGNVNDIQSIEVLKDASSTAIYGSRGANGVILVTTKKPQEGKAQVSFDTNITWNTWRNKPELLSAYEFAQAHRYVKGENTISDADFEAYKNGTKGVDWVDLMSRDGWVQRYYLNISGGSSKTRYAISASVGDTKAQVITVHNKNYGVKATLDTEIAPWLNLNGYIYGSRSERHNSVDQGELNSWSQWSPCMDLFNEATGRYNFDPYSSLGKTSPYAGKVASYNDDDSHSMNGFADLRIKLPLKGLTLSLQGMYNRSQSVTRWVDLDMRSTGEENMARHRSDQSYTIRNINNLTYQTEIGDHRLTAMAVYETMKYEWTRIQAQVNAFENDEMLGYWALGSGRQTTDQGFKNEGMQSVFGRIVYSYKGKYSFTGTYRADAASQFRGDNKWGYFPSAGVAWNISEENFFNKNLIQQLKLRASYGTTGNHGVSAYSTIANLARDFTAYGPETGSDRYYGWWPAEFSNPNLRWEQTESFNIGLDMSLLNQRVSLTTDWFVKNTTDLLFQKELPGYAGGGSRGGLMWSNEGDLKNTGWELTLNAWPVRSRFFTWEANFTTSYVQTEVKALAGGVDRIIPDKNRGSNDQGGLFILQVGLPIGLLNIQEFAGFNDEGAALHYQYIDGQRVGTTINNDMENKRIQERSTIPKWHYGLNNSLSYKNWDLNVFFRATGAYSRLNRSRFMQSCMTGASRFISSREAYYRSWDRVADKSKAEFASLTNPHTQYVAGSTQWLENGMFLRCQNITIGYMLPKKTTTFADIHLSASVENLFVLTKYKGLDPETVSEVSTDSDTAAGSYDTTHGFDNGSVPMPRAFTFRVRFNF